MDSLIVSLIPVAFGIVISPLAVIALVAVLFSRRAARNSIAFLTGWVIGIVGGVGVSYVVFVLLQVHERRQPPLWVPMVHLVLAGVMFVGAWFVFTRQRARLHAMTGARSPGDIASAAPQLPSVLAHVAEFSTIRCFLLGLGLFVLNPVDLSCAVAVGLDLRLSGVAGYSQFAAAVLFVVVAASSVALPVGYLMIYRDRATAPLEKLRTWVAGNTKLLNAALLMLIAVMQLTKGVQGL